MNDQFTDQEVGENFLAAHHAQPVPPHEKGSPVTYYRLTFPDHIEIWRATVKNWGEYLLEKQE